MNDPDIERSIEWTRRFLSRAYAEGDVDDGTYERLRGRLVGYSRQRAEIPVPTVPVPMMPASLPPFPPIPSFRSKPSFRPMPPAPIELPRPARPTGPGWFERLRLAVASDIAVHGLAYLGVVLVFGGTLGFMLFSFGSLPPGSRPLAELAIPTVLLGSAVFLRRRGSPVVATALGLVGGTLLPMVVFASYADGVPPDIHDEALAAGVTITSLTLALVYAVVAARWPDVSVRFLVAPMLWIALWGVGLSLQPGPQASLNEWTAWQFALVAAGVAGTAIFVRVRPGARLARDARPSVIPGALLALGFGLLLAGSEGWPWGPVVVLGLASLVTSELVAPRLNEPLVQAVQPALLWLTVAGLREGHGDVMAGMVGVVASLLLLEWQARRRPGDIPLVAGFLGAGAGLGLTMTDPTAAAVSSGIASVWAHARRIRPIAGLAVGQLMEVAATVVPIAFAAALMDATSDGMAAVVLGTIALVASVAARKLRRGDMFLRGWTFGAAIAVAILTASLDMPAWQATLAAALSAAAVALTSMPAPVRVWTVVPIGSWASLLALDASGLPAETAIVVVAVAASALAAVTSWRSGIAEHVAAAAGVVAVASLQGIPGGWQQVGALAAIAAAAGSITIAGEVRGIGVADLLLRVGQANGVRDLGRLVPASIFLVALAGLCVSAANAMGILSRSPEEVGVLLSALALAEAGTTWLVRTRTPLTSVIGIGASILALAGAVVAAPAPSASALSLAFAIATVAAMAPEARRTPMSWVAWAGSVALAARLSQMADLAFSDGALMVAAWAAVLLVGGLALDDARAGRRSAGELVREGWLAPVVAVGAVTFLPALILALPGSDVRIATVAIGGATIVAAVALQIRLGALTVGAYLLMTLAASVLSPWSPTEDPWVAIPWAAALLIVALVTRSISTDLAPARRWDLPPFAVAFVTVLFGLSRSAELGELAATWIGAGTLALGVAWALRAPTWGVASAILVTVGAVDAGPEWGALASAATAIGLAWIAASPAEHRPEAWRAVQVAAALSACLALVEVARFTGWSSTELAGAAASLAATATVTTLIVWTRRPGSPWMGQAGLAAIAYDAVAAWAAASAWPSRSPLVAVLLVTAAETAAGGIVLRKGSLLMAAPPLACVAWLVGAEDILQQSIQWSSVPIGLSMLAVVSIGRWDRRRRERPSVEPSLVLLEYAGMATIVVPPLVEIVTVSPGRGLMAIGFGAALAAWGILTKVRRRLLVGAGTVVTAVLLMIAGPMARLVPEVEGATLWILLVVLGFAMLAVATSLERGRAKLSAALRRLDELLAGWE